MLYENKNQILRFRAFTLTEIVVVLSVIGVLTAILMPMAMHSAPDENVIKFKKGNSTLGSTIRELVSSNEYYYNGDLGVKPDKSLVNTATYFCQTFADTLATKQVTCSSANEGIENQHLHVATVNGIDNTNELKETADEQCKTYQKTEIITNDSITYYSVSPAHHFAVLWDGTYRLFGSPGQWNSSVQKDAAGNVIPGTEKVESPFDLIYKIFCMDIDGINNGEDPFGYGIRADGKILYGKRAEEWLQKSIHQGD